MIAQMTIFPNLWFDTDAEEAVAFYIATFGGRELSRMYYPEGIDYPEGLPGDKLAGRLCTIEFELRGQRLIALNGHSPPTHTDALSLMVETDSQQELDRIWAALEAGGGKGIACGWIHDRWGVRWQVVPRQVNEIIATGDRAAIARMSSALWSMVKLDTAALETAARGRAA